MARIISQIGSEDGAVYFGGFMGGEYPFWVPLEKAPDWPDPQPIIDKLNKNYAFYKAVIETAPTDADSQRQNLIADMKAGKITKQELAVALKQLNESK